MHVWWQMFFPTCWGWWPASKKSKKGGGQESVAFLKEGIQLGCVSQDTKPPKKSILRKSGKLGADSDTLRRMGSPAKHSKKSGVQDQLPHWRVFANGLCVSQVSHPRKSIPRKEGKMGSDHEFTFSKGTWPQQNSGNKGSIARNHSKVWTSRPQSVCAKHGIWRKMSLSSRQGTRPRSTPLPKHG